MGDKDKSVVPEQISCEICLKEVPKSDAQSVEVNDYAMYFCGLDCFDKWQKRQEQGKE